MFPNSMGWADSFITSAPSRHVPDWPSSYYSTTLEILEPLMAGLVSIVCCCQIEWIMSYTVNISGCQIPTCGLDLVCHWIPPRCEQHLPFLSTAVTSARKSWRKAYWGSGLRTCPPRTSLCSILVGSLCGTWWNSKPCSDCAGTDFWVYHNLLIPGVQFWFIGISSGTKAVGCWPRKSAWLFKSLKATRGYAAVAVTTLCSIAQVILYSGFSHPLFHPPSVD